MKTDVEKFRIRVVNTLKAIKSEAERTKSEDVMRWEKKFRQEAIKAVQKSDISVHREVAR